MLLNQDNLILLFCCIFYFISIDSNGWPAGAAGAAGFGIISYVFDVFFGLIRVIFAILLLGSGLFSFGFLV